MCTVQKNSIVFIETALRFVSREGALAYNFFLSAFSFAVSWKNKYFLTVYRERKRIRRKTVDCIGDFSIVKSENSFLEFCTLSIKSVHYSVYRLGYGLNVW